MKKYYGSFVDFIQKPDTEQDKIEYIKEAVNYLLESMKSWPVPDFNTLKLIVKDNAESSYSQWRMSVGIKYTEKNDIELPEIIRCRDCKWRDTHACFCKAPNDVRDDWFCSEGERYTDDQPCPPPPKP